MAVHVIDEARRCLNCKKPQCREGCPIHTSIPTMIQMLLNNETYDAAEMLFENNPLSIVCSLICDHEKQCEGHCVLGKKGSPVHISTIENYISDSCFDRLKIDMAPSNGIKVAIIGAGPAGITIAIRLAQKGYKITVFEDREKIGGIMQYGIPDFRLPKTILDRYKKKMRDMGILFRPNIAIGGSVSIDDMFRDGYKSVFIGTGVWRPNTLKIKGETFGNVHFGIHYLRNPEVFDLGESVAVIGAGNAAMDVARTAVRHGASKVTVFSITEEPVASRMEVEYAKVDGVQFEVLMGPVEIVDEGPIMADVEWDEEGKMHHIPGTEKLYPADSTIISISQGPQDRIANRQKELKLNKRGLIQVDENGESTVPGVFASGDVVTGAKTVVEAVRRSKQIAEAMDRYMQGLPLSE